MQIKEYNVCFMYHNNTVLSILTTFVSYIAVLTIKLRQRIFSICQHTLEIQQRQ